MFENRTQTFPLLALCVSFLLRHKTSLYIVCIKLSHSNCNLLYLQKREKIIFHLIFSAKNVVSPFVYGYGNEQN